ncbi:HupE/UreJ family protein [Shewanella acanthi]|uniref:HupE/UreJ family protein n=1 Tax=Shewanella acanthi TaxID=2864212 RepID=UPI001C654F52|nr:HupE/UreJ family protein [Shewanella acanthi]QYJ80471.1 HupE/UreJ family protein [Shewanella acanthi]
MRQTSAPRLASTLTNPFHFTKLLLIKLLILLGLMLPSTAHAHLVNTGLGPVYDGISHLFITPEDLLTTITLALYCGLMGAKTGRLGMFVFPIAWAIGGFIGLQVTIDTTWPIAAFSFVFLGLILAADLLLPKGILIFVMALIGVCHGAINGEALQNETIQSGFMHTGSGLLGLIGTVITLFILMTLFSALVVTLKAAWSKIAVRVFGSWVCASGILMFGWYLKGLGL